MKTNSNQKLTMKLVAILLLLSVLSSCSEDGVEEMAVPEEVVESDEIAEIVAGAVATDTQGMTAQLEASAKEAEDVDAEEGDGGRTEQESACGQEFTDQFNLQSPDNLAISYDYSFEYIYAFGCNQFMVPNLMQFSMTQSGEMDAPRFSSVNSSSGGWMLNGLEPSSTEYSIDGNYDREGVHSSKIGDQGSVDFDLSIALSEVKMNKGNYVISEGTGSFSIEGSTISGESFAASGSLDYLGNQEVLLTINGDSYIVNLWTGEVTPA